MVQPKSLIACVFVSAVLLGAGCGSSSTEASPADQVSTSEEEAAARADAMHELTPELRAMRRAVESGAILEGMDPCEYPEWLQDASHLDEQLEDVGDAC
jgi:outer membrane murein-binding lipoprotein Lpp